MLLLHSQQGLARLKLNNAPCIGTWPGAVTHVKYHQAEEAYRKVWCHRSKLEDGSLKEVAAEGQLSELLAITVSRPQPTLKASKGVVERKWSEKLVLILRCGNKNNQLFVVQLL